jgi:hypothetical protein
MHDSWDQKLVKAEANTICYFELFSVLSNSLPPSSCFRVFGLLKRRIINYQLTALIP